MLRTSEEERHYGTIWGSALATQIALSHSRAQSNPRVERGHSHKIRIKKLSKDKAEDKSTQTARETKGCSVTCSYKHRQFCIHVDIDSFNIEK